MDFCVYISLFLVVDNAATLFNYFFRYFRGFRDFRGFDLALKSGLYSLPLLVPLFISQSIVNSSCKIYEIHHVQKP